MDIISGQALFLLFCFILSCFFILSTIKSSRRSPRTASIPPGPPRLPIIGNIHLVGKNPHRSFADLSKVYGPIMSLKLGSLNTVVVTSPEAAREVLRTHDQILSGRTSTNSIRSINHHDVSVVWLPSSSPRWRLLRKISATQVFSPQRIEATKDLRMKKVKELVTFMSESSEKEEAVDISHASFITVVNIISNILFSVDLCSYDSKNSNGFQELVIGRLEAGGKPDAANYFPILSFLDLQSNRKTMKVCTERLFSVFRGFIDAKIAEKLLPNEPKDVSKKDLVDVLLELTEGDEAELNINDIEHFLLDLFTAGTDTSSSTVEWAMTELLINPNVMAKAQAEIDHMIGQNGIVEESDIFELPYLQAVVKETFRLHPPAPLLIPRKAESDVEVLGFMVQKDTQVLVNVWAIGRDQNVWENPNLFDPERFLGNKIDVKGKDYKLISREDPSPLDLGRIPTAGFVVCLVFIGDIFFRGWRIGCWLLAPKSPGGVRFARVRRGRFFGAILYSWFALTGRALRR